MSGIRLFTFREGDRSEYLASFLLSALGLCTGIARQEDIGIDFHCSLADREAGVLTFGSPFLLQVKSASTTRVDLLPPRRFKPISGQMPQHLAWLFRQELPVFLALVDKRRLSIRFFSLSALWFLHRAPDCAAIRLVPRANRSNTRHVAPPVRKKAVSKKPAAYLYEVDLGLPVAAFTAHDLDDPSKIAAIKDRLRTCIHFEQLNRLFFMADIPHFYWLAETDPARAGPIPAYFYDEVPPKNWAAHDPYSFLSHALVPFAMRFKKDGDSAALAALKTIFQRLRPEALPKEVKAAFPELFEPKP